MTCLRYPYHGIGLFSLVWCWTQFGQDGPVVRFTAESAANAAGYKNFRSWEFLDVVISVTWKFREEGPELFRLGVCIRSVKERGYLISRAPQDGALVSPSLDCAKTLFHKRVGSGRQVAAFSYGLTLLGLLPELPPKGTVCIVEPLAMAGPEVGGILRHRESMLVAPEQRDAARPALAHASDVELGQDQALNCYSEG